MVGVITLGCKRCSFHRRFSGLTSSKAEDESNDVMGIQSQADINIFTVASGLLYEVSLEGYLMILCLNASSDLPRS